jgi:TetR/AcrR family transcriptional regulator, tetracycline repressor protein
VALSRSDVLRGALAILDEYGLGDLTMRRLAGSLGVQPGALYWHVANKQALLGAIADEILADLGRDMPVGDWDQRINELAHRLRAALLAHRDGAEVVAAAHALRAGQGTTVELMSTVLTDAGFPRIEAQLAATAILHYVFGHTADEQSYAQSVALGVTEPPEPSRGGLTDDASQGCSPNDTSPSSSPNDTSSGELLGETARFGFGLSVIIDGLRTRLA